ncbi:MAG: hypothetical protein KC609_05680 [Myxococcales bacterium]|nr:hypothetical protein [Myxococcales bacterium]
MSAPRLRYRTIEFGQTDIHVRTLRDTQQFSDDDGAALECGISAANWPIFGVIWDSGRILAELMFLHDVAGKRILEVGCGIALASLVLNQRLADITATDYHPEVAGFLDVNVSLNNGRAIPFVRADWGGGENGLGRFDLLIGSDILYEPVHVSLLAGFIERHAATRCDVVLVDPGRGHHARFSKRMVSLGFSHSQNRPAPLADLVHPFRGHVLRYNR